MYERIRHLLAASLGGIVLLAVPAPKQAHVKPLAIGDPAPGFSVTWIKGEPITKLNPKKIYVLEFWATWCGPCRVVMPHLSELARKYKGRVEVIGVNVWEAGYLDKPYETFLPKVKKFVDQMGDKMAYNVAMETSTLHMTRLWMDAASQTGIPASFLVKDGKVIWVGHPGDLDKILEDVLNGTYDMAAFAKGFEAQTKLAREQSPQMKLVSELFQAVQSAIQVKDYAKALRLIEEASVKLEPKFKGTTEALKLKVYVHSDPDQFLTLGKALKAKDAKVGVSIADAVLKVKEPGLDARLYDAAIEEYKDMLAKGTYAGSLPDAYVHNWMSIIYDRSGRIAEAIAAQEKAIELGQKELDAGRGPFTKDLLDDYREDLETYRKKIK